MGLEILEDLKNIDEIYVPVGGGGLIAGVSIVIKSINPKVRIIGVESTAFPTMKKSIKKENKQSSRRLYNSRWNFCKITWKITL